MFLQLEYLVIVPYNVQNIDLVGILRENGVRQEGGGGGVEGGTQRFWGKATIFCVCKSTPKSFKIVQIQLF